HAGTLHQMWTLGIALRSGGPHQCGDQRLNCRAAPNPKVCLVERGFARDVVYPDTRKLEVANERVIPRASGAMEYGLGTGDGAFAAHWRVWHFTPVRFVLYMEVLLGRDAIRDTCEPTELGTGFARHSDPLGEESSRSIGHRASGQHLMLHLGRR